MGLRGLRWTVDGKGMSPSDYSVEKLPFFHDCALAKSPTLPLNAVEVKRETRVIRRFSCDACDYTGIETRSRKKCSRTFCFFIPCLEK